jgi:hypothetical protein
MPLQDHFHPPLSLRRHWHAFHNSWATYLAADLNQQLPQGYFAEANVQFGIEIDVAAFDEISQGGAVSVPAGPTWLPPQPTLTVPLAVTTDVVEVRVFNTHAGPVLAGAIELVSPANKDRPAHRQAFVSKCAAYLQEGIGLVLVDVVTERSVNLHEELVRRVSPTVIGNSEPGLYATSYRPIQVGCETKLNIWLETLALGQPLPTLPLWLRGGLVLEVTLEASYDRTCREQRIPSNGT